MAFYTYQWASDFLRGGRKKYERPLYDRGLRIWKENKWDPQSDIAIGWRGYGKLVTYKPDGTVVIEADSKATYFGNWNPLRGYSTRLTIMRYAGLKDLYQRDFKFYIVEADAKWVDGKEQGCRYCKQTGLIDLRCWPTSCWNTQEAIDGSQYCPTHPELGHWPNTNTVYAYHRTHHYAPCEHGLKDAHTVKNGQSCHSCNGTKKRMYGARFERTLWDGAPLRIKDGNIIKTAATLLERMVADYVEPIG